MISLLLLFNSQTRVRLQKWYLPFAEKDKKRIVKETISSILTRRIPSCSFIEWKDQKIIYQRYANLFFSIVIDQSDNELIGLETIQRYVEILDQYFGNVCELDIIFNYEKAHFVWDEMVIGGELAEVSRREVLDAIIDQDEIQHDELESAQKMMKW